MPSPELDELRVQVDELQGAVRYLAGLTAKLGAGADVGIYEQLGARQIAKGFPLTGVNLPAGQRQQALG